MLERKDKVMVAASTSNTWHEFHTRLAELNLGIKLRANGLVFYQDKHHLKASTVDRSLSKKRLEQRWGRYSPAIKQSQRRRKQQRYRPAPLILNSNIKSLWRTYNNLPKQRRKTNGVKPGPSWKTFLLAQIATGDPLAATIITANKEFIGVLLPNKQSSRLRQQTDQAH